MLETLGIPIPGETTLIAGAIYAAINPSKFSIFLVIIFAIIGAVIGDNTGYFMGFKYGKTIINKIENILKTNKNYVKSTEKFFEKYGFKAVFIGRFISILRMFIPITAGIHKLKFSKFFLYNILGGISWAILYGIIGFIFGSNIPFLLKLLHDITLTTIIIIVIILIIVIIKKKKKWKILNF
ncbi:DedA family protein [Patescibacteria group bacterium]|nr:DedA family protein [Patescibacteria group bacterium]